MPNDHLKESHCVKPNLKDEIAGLKGDVATLQERAVTRAEHEMALDHLHNELDCIERGVGRTHDQWEEELRIFNQDLQARMIALTGLIVTVVQFCLMWFL